MFKNLWGVFFHPPAAYRVNGGYSLALSQLGSVAQFKGHKTIKLGKFSSYLNSILDLLTSPSIKCLYILTKKVLFTQGVDFTIHIIGGLFFLIISSYFWWDLFFRDVSSLFFRDISSHSHPSQPFSSWGVLSCSGHYWPLHSGLCGYPLSSGPQLTCMLDSGSEIE